MSSNSNKYIKVLISLGSNIDEYNNISEAKKMLNKCFCNLRYSSFVWTKPIGISSGYFFNGLAYGDTSYNLERTLEILKDIESKCGSLKEEKRVGIVRIDLDLMKYGETILHKEDWKRYYIQDLYKELNR